MNSNQQYQMEAYMMEAYMTNNPTSRWMACSQTAPSHQVNQASFERFHRQDQRLTRFPASPHEMSNQESAFYFVNEER